MKWLMYLLSLSRTITLSVILGAIGLFFGGWVYGLVGFTLPFIVMAIIMFILIRGLPK